MFDLLNEKTKYILYPSYYLEIFYPFFGYAKNAAGANILGSEIREFRHPYGTIMTFLRWSYPQEQGCASQIL